MRAALAMAGIGLPVTLIERESQLGGNLRRIGRLHHSQLREEYAMTDKGMQDKYKQQLKVARDRHGKPSEERNAERKESIRLRKAVLDALATGPKTVPELAAKIGADPRKVLWHVAALRKYNEVADGPKQGDYIAYLRK